MGVVHTPCPFLHGFVHGILERLRARCCAVYLCAEQFHPVDVQRLPFHVLRTHENLTFHVEQCGGCGCGDTVLPCACFGY
jgi:hypothetical protein